MAVKIIERLKVYFILSGLASDEKKCLFVKPVFSFEIQIEFETLSSVKLIEVSEKY